MEHLPQTLSDDQLLRLRCAELAVQFGGHDPVGLAGYLEAFVRGSATRTPEQELAQAIRKLVAVGYDPARPSLKTRPNSGLD